MDEATVGDGKEVKVEGMSFVDAQDELARVKILVHFLGTASLAFPPEGCELGTDEMDGYHVILRDVEDSVEKIEKVLKKVKEVT